MKKTTKLQARIKELEDEVFVLRQAGERLCSAAESFWVVTEFGDVTLDGISIKNRRKDEPVPLVDRPNASAYVELENAIIAWSNETWTSETTKA